MSASSPISFPGQPPVSSLHVLISCHFRLRGGLQFPQWVSNPQHPLNNMMHATGMRRTHSNINKSALAALLSHHWRMLALLPNEYPAIGRKLSWFIVLG